MTDRELMQQALEALENTTAEWRALADSGDAGFWKAEDQDDYKQCVAAITALHERLAQPEQEPNKEGSPCPEFWDWLPKAYNFDGNGAFTKYNMEVAFLAGKQTSQPQPEQEPVAHTLNCVCGAVWDIKADGSEEMAHTPDTTPPQRTWQGLTDEEEEKLIHNFGSDPHTLLDEVNARLQKRNT